MFRLPDIDEDNYDDCYALDCAKAYGVECAKAALEAAARECDRQQAEEGECPERASYCAEAIRSVAAEIA